MPTIPFSKANLIFSIAFLNIHKKLHWGFRLVCAAPRLPYPIPPNGLGGDENSRGSDADFCSDEQTAVHSALKLSAPSVHIPDYSVEPKS